MRGISIYVVKGKNLVAKDISFFGHGPTSDPYYTVNFKGQGTESEVQSKTLNPVWNRQWIELGNVKDGETDLLEISIFDRDRFSRDDFMGVVRVSVGELHALGLGEHEFWFTLETDEQHTNEFVSGDILVKISLK